MEVDDQFHFMASLTASKELLVHISKKFGESQNRSGHGGVEKSPWVFLGVEHTNGV
jgi:hypothetical protein